MVSSLQWPLKMTCITYFVLVVVSKRSIIIVVVVVNPEFDLVSRSSLFRRWAKKKQLLNGVQPLMGNSIVRGPI